MKILSTKRLVQFSTLARLVQFSTLADGDPFLYNGNLLIKTDPMKRNDMGDEKTIPCAVNLKNGHHWIFKNGHHWIFMEDVMVDRVNVHIEDD